MSCKFTILAINTQECKMAFEKSVLHSGVGIYLPNKLANVVVDVVGKWCTSDGDDVVFDRRESVSIELDQTDGELSQMVEDMICTMKQGETSQFLIFDGYQLLKQSSAVGPDRVPTMGAEVIFTIHLHSFQQGKMCWMLTDPERLEIARRHKERGSVLFKAGNVRGAAIRYSKAVQCLAAVDPDTRLEVENLEEHEREILSLRHASLMNLSACQLKFRQYDHVVRNCSRVLEEEPGNVKSLFRRAKAQLLGARDYDAARTDLLIAKEADPGNQAVDDLLGEVKVQEAAHRAKYKDALKTMFT